MAYLAAQAEMLRPSARRVLSQWLRTANLTLYHGAQRWEGPPTIRSQRKGHAEHGPGIYLTTSWETANRYAKGGGAVYRMTVRNPRKWAENARLPADDVLAFVRQALGRGKKAQMVAESVERVAGRSPDNTLPAFSIIAIFVNNDLASGSKGPLLADYLVENGIDASLVRQGAEDWVVVFNPALIENVEKLTPKDVGAPGFTFDLPKIP